MKVLIAVLILIFSLQSWTKADQHGLVVDSFHIDRKTIKKIEGSYCGYLIYETGDEYRIISTFKVNQNNEIWGNYIFENYDRDRDDAEQLHFADGEVYKGVFFNGKIEEIIELPDLFKVKVFWTDDFFGGHLDMNFMFGVSFKGDWGDRILDKNTWSGMKCNPETGETIEFK